LEPKNQIRVDHDSTPAFLQCKSGFSDMSDSVQADVSEHNKERSTMIQYKNVRKGNLRKKGRESARYTSLERRPFYRDTQGFYRGLGGFYRGLRGRIGTQQGKVDHDSTQKRKERKPEEKRKGKRTVHKPGKAPFLPGHTGILPGTTGILPGTAGICTCVFISVFSSDLNSRQQ